MESGSGGGGAGVDCFDVGVGGHEGGEVFCGDVRRGWGADRWKIGTVRTLCCEDAGAQDRYASHLT